jgi:LuxR family maltose regulon positive regulatory protein
VSLQIEGLALQALVWEEQGQGERALAALGETLALAEPGGYVRLFVDHGPAMATLLARARARGLAPGYVGQLLAAYPEAGPATAPSPESPLIEPLSEREREVLRLVADGLTNQQIADELVIALSTVKSHTHSIYGKLGVQNRTQAIAQARALDLL